MSGLAKQISTSEEIVKLGVMPPEGHATIVPLLFRFDCNQPLSVMLQEICENFNLTSPENFGLVQVQANNRYITEITKKNLKNGDVLQLAVSPFLTVEGIIKLLNSTHPKEVLSGLEKLSNIMADPTVATEMKNQTGVDLLVHMIELGNDKGKALEYSFKSFLDLMRNNLVSYGALSDKFVKQVSKNVIQTKDSSHEALTGVALAVLEHMLLHSSEHYQCIASQFTFELLRQFLGSQNPEVQKNSLALMNALCLKSPEANKVYLEKKLAADDIRVTINEELNRKLAEGEMAHHLHVYQQLTFNILKRTSMTAVDPSDSNCQFLLSELRTHAFINPEKTQATTGHKEEYRKLGFTNYENPFEDFKATPPGMLSLECLVYFATCQSDRYFKIVHESIRRGAEYHWLLVETANILIKVLCEILRIGEISEEKEYHPMFFSTDGSFKQFFCLCMRLFAKSWKEMRARKEDFPQVLFNVRKQIELGLNEKPLTLDRFWMVVVQQFSYNQVIELRVKDQWQKEEALKECIPVQELQEQIRPEIMELVRQRRLNFLVQGTRFHKLDKHGKTQGGYWYCRLTTNHQTLQSGDVEADVTPSIDQLNNRISVRDVHSLHTGKQCDFVRGGNDTWAFSVLATNNQKLNFVASSQEDYNMWLDGLNILLGKPMPSKQAKKDLDTLLSMEMCIRLVDTGNIPLPDKAPVIPPPPLY